MPLPKAAWHIPHRPWLSTRRLLSLIGYTLKRRMGRDLSWSPPGPSDVPLDLFMPTVDKDAAMLDYALTYAKKNIMHPIGTIYLVAPAKSTRIKALAKKHGCTFVDEDSILDFPKEEIDYHVDGYNRNGWVYKMMLNLAADIVSKSRYILILDSDTCFIAPQIFLHNDRPLFNLSNEYHQAYFDANRALLNLSHRPSRSFITHYMLFDAEVLKSLRAAIEKKWNEPWHRGIIKSIQRNTRSGFADYEVYGDYYVQSGPTKPILNYWSNLSVTVESLDQIDGIIESMQGKARSVSLHNYLKDY